MDITLIAGARPNFMKVAPIIREIKDQMKRRPDLSYQLVHTGQHYDKMLSQTFFEELNIPAPKINLEVGSGTQAEQTASIMVKFEQFLFNNPTDLVLVVGDVNSTMACSIVAKKLHIQVCHVEAGIRSLDLDMPEEINRMVTDSISDFFFTTSEFANDNLRRQGVPEKNIYYVGNTMIDTLQFNLKKFKKPFLWDAHDLQPDTYTLITLHRPSNVDDITILGELLKSILNSLPANDKVIFPVHPRTRKTIDQLALDQNNLILIEPLGYLEFQYLVKNAKIVITDSGGIQEETTYLGIPCLTIRQNTERPETISEGTNILIGHDMALLSKSIQEIATGKWKKGTVPKYWDGKTSQRIVNHILQRFQ